MGGPIDSCADGRAKLLRRGRRQAGRHQRSDVQDMGARPRKLTGILLLLIGLPLYAAAATMIAVNLLPDHRLIEAAYFLAAGLAWIFPVMPLIRWMNRDHRGQDSMAE